MALLEIIRGKLTTDQTLAHAMDFARAIGKTPIVVNDARGFYTTRVVMAYQAEAFDMFGPGRGTRGGRGWRSGIGHACATLSTVGRRRAGPDPSDQPAGGA
jgi:3-hydroxyacyl-CoA dehydrogenase